MSQPAGTISRCIVFGGGLKASPLQAMCHLSVLNVKVLPGVSPLERILALVAAAHSASELSVRVVSGTPVPAPWAPPAPAPLKVSVAAEPKGWRGAAGVLRDMCEDLPPDANILVVEGARWFDTPLAPLLTAHAAAGADATIARSSDLSPAGVYVIRRSALDLAPAIGFLDLKEQLFGKMSKAGLRLIVHPLDSGSVLPLRTLAEFLAAARHASGGGADWTVIDPAAVVDPGAVVLSSVVEAGARVGEGALVARSLVLEGARVEAGSEIVDCVVQPGVTLRAPGAFRSLRAPERSG